MSTKLFRGLKPCRLNGKRSRDCKLEELCGRRTPSRAGICTETIYQKRKKETNFIFYLYVINVSIVESIVELVFRLFQKYVSLFQCTVDALVKLCITFL